MVKKLVLDFGTTGYVEQVGYAWRGWLETRPDVILTEPTFFDIFHALQCEEWYNMNADSYTSEERE